MAAEDPTPRLKDFHLGNKIGSGSYATVYRMIHKTTNENVAVKCIKKSSLNKSSTENMLREIEIMKNIRNDYIVQLKDFQWDETYIYLIMEYCSGGDLLRFIKSRRTIPEKYVRRFVQQIACALMHLNEIGIAHMDLKPQNILLTSVNNPSLKLADFGFAQYLSENIYSKSLRGSPLYMAPEILKNKIYDSKVDLWSVGVILYEVIFGQAPFSSSTFEELEKKILDDTPIKIPTHVLLSETCKDLLRRLLERNPAERISFQDFFNHPFVDLEHMPSEKCLPKATQLLKKATSADDAKDYVQAQKLYLKAIEYLIPAIKYESNPTMKQEMREKAKIYLKRSEEISNILNPRGADSSVDSLGKSLQETCKLRSNSDESSFLYKQAHTTPVRSISQNDSETNSGASFTPTSSQIISDQASSVDSGVDAFRHELPKGNSDIQNLLLKCFQLDDRFKNLRFGQFEGLYEEYENSIPFLIDFARQQREERSAKLLKQYITGMLTKAEFLKQKINEIESRKQFNQANEDITEDEESNSSYYVKQCSIQ